MSYRCGGDGKKERGAFSGKAKATGRGSSRALWGLKLLDTQELVDAGAISDRDYETWDRFQADRMMSLLTNLAKTSPAVWVAIWPHRPKVDDNIVSLRPRQKDTANAR